MGSIIGGDVLDDFIAGRTALGNLWTQGLLRVEDTSISKIAGKVGYYPPPKFERKSSMVASWMMGINKNSKHKEEAYKYIYWATRPDTDKKLVTETMHRGMPVRLSTYNDPEVQKVLPTTAQMAESAPFFVPLPLFAEYEELLSELSIEIQNAIAGKKSPKQALDDAADNMYKIMERAGYYKK